MKLYEENELLLKMLQERLNSLGILELEEQIRTRTFQENIILVLGERVYNEIEKLNKLENRIYAVNAKIIYEHVPIINIVNNINYMKQIPCGIQYLASNMNKYWVARFYSDMRAKYANKTGTLQVSGLSLVGSMNLFNPEVLEAEDQEYALILDKYLLLCSIRDRIEAWMDCIKGIQCNYIEEDKIN